MLNEIHEKVIALQQKGIRIIKFNVGDPDQSTPDEIVRAAFQTIKEGKTKYGSSLGENNLREKIASTYKANKENIVIVPGSKWAIFSLMNLLLQKGDNFILPTPHWTDYQLVAEKIGAEIKFLRCNLETDWKIDVEKMKDLINDKTKMIILNSPNNPTSKIIDEKTFREITELGSDKDVIILSDEAYSDISFKTSASVLDFSKNHIYIDSFSKTFAMSGWRLGFVILPAKELAEKMTTLNQITITCVPPFIQEAGIKALEIKDKIAEEMRKEYKKRADLACDILSKTKLKFVKPDAPFYLFLRCFTDSEKLTFDLLDRGVAITPGTAFGDFKDYFRISLTVSEEEIKEGLEKIASYLS